MKQFRRIFFLGICMAITSCEQRRQNTEYAGIQVFAEIGVERANSAKDQPYQFSRIISVDCDSVGNIYVLDDKASTVKVFLKNGDFLKEMFRQGKGPEELNGPRRICINKFSDHLFILQERGYQIKEFDKEGNYIKLFALAEPFFHYYNFIDHDRLVYVSKGTFEDKIYHSLKILNLRTLRIEREFAPTERHSMANVYQRFVIRDNILWTSPGDGMEIIGYDLNTGEAVATVPLPEVYHQHEIAAFPIPGGERRYVLIHNYSQPFSINGEIYTFVARQEFIPKKEITRENIGDMLKTRHVSIYKLENSGIKKIIEITDLDIFPEFQTVWDDHLVVSSTFWDLFPKIMVLELGRGAPEKGTQISGSCGAE